MLMDDPMAAAIKKKRSGLTINIGMSPDDEDAKPNAKGSDLAPEAPELDDNAEEESMETPEDEAAEQGLHPEMAMMAKENGEGKDFSMFDDIAADLGRSGKKPKSLTERASADYAADKKNPKKY